MLFSIGLAHADPLKIRGAWVAPLANWASVWVQKKDLAVHFGKSYVFEPVHYAGTPPMITAIANNELEIGNLAFSTLPIAIGNAGLDDIRVISDDFQDGVDGYYSNEYDVLKDGPVKKIEDLKGKVVATNVAGAASMSPCAPCCASTGSKPTATIPSSKRRSPRCAPCSRRRRST